MTLPDEPRRLRAEAPLEHYEDLYTRDAGSSVSRSAYDRPYWQSHYYPLYKAALDAVVALGGKTVLEVGCGSGSFAHMLFDRTSIGYQGFDFSQAAVAKAVLRTGKPECFSVARADDDSMLERAYDAIVCLEVLEHIEDDLDVVRRWRPGCTVVCSVPNFDDTSHVRLFRSEDEVRERYGALLDIRRLRRVPRSLVRGRGWRAYGRQLRWSRDNPRRFLGLLGYKTFENVSGWIVFAGKRRTTT